jgi:hypothetical protein
MPYDRDEVIASVTDCYNFLITHLHFQPSELKTPPPTGWPQIDQTRLAFLGKKDAAIDLVQHLPYLPHGKEEKHIYDHTVCVDYTHESVDRKQETPELVITAYFEPEHEWVDLCPYDKFKERHEDVVVLGRPERASASKLFQLNYKFPPNADATIVILGRQWLLHLPRYVRRRSGHVGRYGNQLRQLRQCKGVLHSVEAVVRRDQALPSP